MIAVIGEDHELLARVKNIGHKELGFYDDALALKTLQDRRGISRRQVPNVTGLSKTHVPRLLNTLDAPDVLKELWRDGDIEVTALVELKNHWSQFSSGDPAWISVFYPDPSCSLCHPNCLEIDQYFVRLSSKQSLFTPK